jgi:hypothetical protein
VLAAAVLAFVQAGVVAVASAYVFLFVSFARIAASEGAAPSPDVEGLAGEGTVLAWLQLASVVLLVAGGVLALGRRARRRPAWLVLAGALMAQIVLALYWGVRLDTLTTDVTGPDPAGAFAWFALFFAAMPLVALGLVLVGPGRAWFREEPLPGQG